MSIQHWTSSIFVVAVEKCAIACNDLKYQEKNNADGGHKVTESKYIVKLSTC